MAEVTEKPEEPGSDTEMQTTCIKQQMLRITGEKNGIPWQPNNKEAEKVWKILEKVKLALRQNADKRKKGKKSKIIVFYYRRHKKKKENQRKKDQESLEESPTSSTALCLPGPGDLCPFKNAQEK